MSANETEKPEDTTDVLVPPAAERVVTLGKENDFTLVQRPLSFFGKLEVFAVLGGALDKAMAGPDGLTLSELFDGPSPLGNELNEQNFTDADTFVKGIVKLVQYAPALFGDLYVIFLGVPRGEREYVKAVMALPESEGGLSDEDGAGILDTFVDQNWDVMVDFFNSRVKPLFSKISSKVNQAQESAPSKPLKNTRRTTPKA